MDDELVDLLERYDECVRSGRHPANTTHLAQQLDPSMQREFFEAAKCLELLARIRRADAADSQATGTDTAGPCAHAARFGRFEIVREIGSGGHGIVFLAWDPAARRHVAIKAPHPDALFTLELRERFIREGIAAARLTHPNIVSVLEVDRSGPVCFIVSTYSHGRSLASVLGDGPTAFPLRVSAQWVAELADGVEHAHRNGVLHRDIKPANVVLESRGIPDDLQAALPPGAAADRLPLNELTPKLTDFGLAKLIDVENARTRTGVLLGTPAYMAPEQVDVSLGRSGPASDVYGLGTILYECLTSRPPFASESQADLLRRIAAGDLTSPRQIRPEIPRDLEAICLRAMARKPGDRYSSPAELAADLRRFLSGDATRARPLSIVGHAVKWSQRRPAAAALALLAILAAFAFAAGAVWHIRQMGAALADAARARTRAEAGENRLKQLIYLRDMQEAHRALNDQDVLKASAALARHETGKSRHQGFLWRHLRARASEMPRRVAAHEGHAHTVDYSPDGSQVVTAGADGFVRVWDAESGELLSSRRTNAAEANVARFSPDGNSVAVADSDGRVWVLDVGTNAVVAESAADPLENVSCLTWTRDGRIVAAGNPGDVALEWNVSNGHTRVVSIGHTEEVNALSLSPDETLLATGSSDGLVNVHEWADRATRRAQLQPEHSHVTCVTFSPDGRFLATAGVYRTVRVWSVDTWTSIATYEGHVDRIGAVDFSPHDSVVAIGDGLGVIREWDWQTDRVTTVVDSGQGRIMHAAYASTAPRLAACFTNGSLCLWDKRTRSVTSLPEMYCLFACFTGDSRHLVSGTDSRGLSVFDTRTRTVTRLGEQPDGIVGIVPVGKREVGILGRAECGAAYRHGPIADPPTIVRLTNESAVGKFAVTPDGRILMTTRNRPPDYVRFWDTATGRSLGATNDRREVVHALCVSFGGDLLATGSHDRIRLWDIARKRNRLLFASDVGTVETLGFSPDDRWLAAGGRNGRVSMWNVETGEKSARVLEHSAPVQCLAFCPDEPLLATGDEAGVVRLWSTTSGEEVLRLAAFASAVKNVAFSADGQWLAASHIHLSEHETRLWHAPRE